MSRHGPQGVVLPGSAGKGNNPRRVIDAVFAAVASRSVTIFIGGIPLAKGLLVFPKAPALNGIVNSNCNWLNQ